MTIRAVLKMIGLFLALGVFLTVGVNALMNGEELIWAVGKSLTAFIVCYVVVGWFAGVLSMSVEGADYVEPVAKNGGKKKAGAAE